VVDDDNVLATSFHCTNFSGVTENVRIVVRSLNSTLVANVAVPHDTTIYLDQNLHTGVWATVPPYRATRLTAPYRALS
jgi:hypothetical protein